MPTTAAPIELRRALQKQVLKATAKRVIDIFNSWDEDGDGIITKREFRRAIIPLLNIPAQPGDFDALFDMFDADGSGEITIQELSHALRRGQGVELHTALREGAKGKIRTQAKTRIALRKEAMERGSRLGKVDLKQLGADGVPEERRKADAVSELITRALSKQHVRVIDLFHEWDENGDGLVSRAEFYKALPLLGIDASRKEADSLFNSWDPDESGSITFQELSRALRPAHASDDGRPGSADRRAKPPELMPAVHRVSPSPHLYFARLVSQQFVPPHPWLGSSHPTAPSPTTGTGGAPPSSTPRAAWQGPPGYSLRSAVRGGGAAAAAAAAAIETAMPTPSVAAPDDDEEEYVPRVSLTLEGSYDTPVAALTIEVVGSAAAARQPQPPQSQRRPPQPQASPAPAPTPQQWPFRVLAGPPVTKPPTFPRPVATAASTRRTASTEPAPRVSLAVGGSDEAPLVALTIDVVAAAAAARPRPVSTPAPRRAAADGGGDDDDPWASVMVDLADLGGSMPPLSPRPPPPLRATASSLTMRPCEAEMAWRTSWPASPDARPSTGGGGGGGAREPPRAVTRLNRPEAPNHGLPEYGRPQNVVGEAAPSPRPKPKPPPSPSPYAPTPTPRGPPATPTPRASSPPRPSPIARPPGKGGRPFPRVSAPPSPRRRGPRKAGTINNMEHLTAYRLNPELRLVQQIYK